MTRQESLSKKMISTDSLMACEDIQKNGQGYSLSKWNFSAQIGDNGALKSPSFDMSAVLGVPTLWQVIQFHSW